MTGQRTDRWESETAESYFRRRLEACGFDPDATTYEFHGCFTFKEAMRSLLKSTRLVPVPVYLTKDSDDDPIRIAVVIDMVRPFYFDHDADANPEWIFEGWVLPDARRRIPRTVRRVRIHVASLDKAFDDTADYTWQWLPDEPCSTSG
jgi:hypothetical protein